MKKLLFFMFSLCLFAGISRADDFTAEVENNQVVAGEPFVLTLTYSGNEKNIQPDLSVLQNDFQIYIPTVLPCKHHTSTG